MARIVFTLEDGVEIETELDADVITVGRHPDSIVVLPSGSVSSHHGTIKRRGESFYVQDLGTTNGTKLNGVEVEEAKLSDGDKVTFGDISGIVHLTKAPSPAARLGVPEPDPVAPAAPPAVPSASRRRVAQKRAGAVQYRESTGCASFLIFLLLMVLAFIIGLHVRHGVETGGFLFGDVLGKITERMSEHVEEGGDAAGTTPALDESALKQIDLGMSLAQVERVLGKGTETDEDPVKVMTTNTATGTMTPQFSGPVKGYVWQDEKHLVHVFLVEDKVAAKKWELKKP